MVALLRVGAIAQAALSYDTRMPRLTVVGVVVKPAIVVGGLNPWAHEWHAVQAERVPMPHPSLSENHAASHDDFTKSEVERGMALTGGEVWRRKCVGASYVQAG